MSCSRSPELVTAERAFTPTWADPAPAHHRDTILHLYTSAVGDGDADEDCSALSKTKIYNGFHSVP